MTIPPLAVNNQIVPLAQKIKLGTLGQDLRTHSTFPRPKNLKTFRWSMPPLQDSTPTPQTPLEVSLAFKPLFLKSWIRLW